MTAMPVSQRMSAEEFLALPLREDSPREELVNGELVVSEGSPLLATVQGRIFFALESWVRAEPGRGSALLPVDVGLDERNVYAPDVLWYPQGRGPGPEQRPSPVPALAAEVRSPSTWIFNLGAKKSGYERHGLSELWLVDTSADEVLAFRRSQPDVPFFDAGATVGRGEKLSSPLLPGFALSIDELFQRD